MQTLFRSISLAGLLSLLPMVVSPLSARAQDASHYDTRMEKRADLRLKYLQAQCDAAKKAGQPATPVAAHPDRAHLVDFMARAAKRADLRIRVSQVGIDKAYAEWMQREHGH